MRVLRGVLSCVVLTACASFSPRDTPLVVTDQNLRLMVPDGFCHDNASLQIGKRRAFVVYGSCAAIKGGDGPATPIATISVSLDRETANPAVLAAFLETGEGRALLSRQGQAEDVQITSAFAGSRAIYLQVKDTGDGNLDGFAQDYWRAYVTRDDATLAVTLHYPVPGPSNPQMGLDTLKSFVAKLSGPTPQTGNPFGKGGILGRLLN